MPRAADGTPVHSLSRARHHDEMMASKKPAPRAVTEPPKKEGEETDEQHGDIKDVVAEHGPAHEVHVHHDHEAKHSHVISHHGEGHKHEEHFDGENHVEEAHKHAHEAAGGEPDEENEDDEELGEEAGEEMPEMEEHAGRIPGMA